MLEKKNGHCFWKNGHLAPKHYINIQFLASKTNKIYKSVSQISNEALFWLTQNFGIVVRISDDGKHLIGTLGGFPLLYSPPKVAHFAPKWAKMTTTERKSKTPSRIDKEAPFLDWSLSLGMDWGAKLDIATFWKFQAVGGAKNG